MIKQILENLELLISVILILSILNFFFLSLKDFLTIWKIENFCDNLISNLELLRYSPTDLSLSLSSSPGKIRISKGKLEFHSTSHSCERYFNFSSVNAELYLSHRLRIRKIGEEVVLENE